MAEEETDISKLAVQSEPQYEIKILDKRFVPTTPATSIAAPKAKTTATFTIKTDLPIRKEE